MRTLEIKDFGIAVKILGMKIEYETTFSYSMSQHTMILNLIEELGLNAIPVGTLMEEVVFLLKTSICCQQQGSLFRTSNSTTIYYKQDMQL
jgi:hypothetical protein